MERIGFGPRFGVALIDLVCLIVLSFILGMFGISMMMATQGGGGWFGGVLVAVIMLGYWSLEIFKAQSPGKMALGLIIKNADGSDASQDVLIKRFAIKQVGGIINAVAAITTITILTTLGGLAGLIIFLGCFMVFRESKQALHDQLAQTAVFKQGASQATSRPASPDSEPSE